MSSEDTLIQLLSGCVLWSLEDETWQMIGFKHRPKLGSLFVLFFPKWKINLETRLSRELTFFCLSTEILAKKISKEDTDSLSIYFGNNTATPNLFESFGYASSKEAAFHCRESLSEYLATAPSEWTKLFIQRAELDYLPKQNLKNRILLGVTKLGATLKYNLDAIEKRSKE